MTQSDVIKLEIPRSARFVAIPRKMIEWIGANASLSEEEIADLRLAVGEACTNAVKFGDSGSDVFSVHFTIEHDRLVIEVCNSGPAFQWEKRSVENTKLCDTPEGGLGLYLIEQLADEMEIRSECGTTSVTIVKKLAHREYQDM